MAFIPYAIRADRLPKLRKNHVLKIGANFFVVKMARLVRKYRAENGVLANQALNLPYNVFYTNICGDVSLKRVVHLHYLALTSAVVCDFSWLTEPLMSAWVRDTLDSNIAGLGGVGQSVPYELNKWTYDESMSLFLTKALGNQTLYFELMEYEVEEYKGKTPPAVYLELDEKGEAEFHGY